MPATKERTASANFFVVHPAAIIGLLGGLAVKIRGQRSEVYVILA